jgi:rhodanese-related sulfurtransferase
MRSKTLPKPYNIDNIVRLNQKGESTSLEMVEPNNAQALVEKNPRVKFLDVRTPLEFSEVHIKDALHVPIDTLSLKMTELAQSQHEYIVVCRTGNRAFMAADMLLHSGIHGAKVLQGGMLGWQRAGLHVIKGVSTISLERQVRVIAGCMVLCGIVLSWLFHWAFILISVFVGCGMIFAGITDNCMMGSFLMKLPYNKKIYKSKLSGGSCAISG